MEKIYETLLAFQVAMLTRRDERGQGTLEYVGMIIVAAILVVAVLEATELVDLGGAFQTAVESVTG